MRLQKGGTCVRTGRSVLLDKDSIIVQRPRLIGQQAVFRHGFSYDTGVDFLCISHTWVTGVRKEIDNDR